MLGTKSNKLNADSEKWLKTNAKHINKVIGQNKFYQKNDLEKLKARARLMAGNEAGNLYAQTLPQVAKQYETEYYIWKTKGDNRVRKEHKKLEGKVRHIDDKPRPSEEWNCRCEAVFVKGLKARRGSKWKTKT
jgi:SPP1 gp7 family putative phage head morphogenesis protein